MKRPCQIHANNVCLVTLLGDQGWARSYEQAVENLFNVSTLCHQNEIYVISLSVLLVNIHITFIIGIYVSSLYEVLLCYSIIMIYHVWN